MQLERYSHVMHIVSTVIGELSNERLAVDALYAVFPAGTLSGAPKPRAMELIESHEPVRRGIYGGAIGYVDFTGNLDTCIAIRTAIIKDGIAYVQAGAGIVADSIPESEDEECCNKAAAVLGAIAAANNLRSI
jgi:anthranilate synthase component 1